MVLWVFLLVYIFSFVNPTYQDTLIWQKRTGFLEAYTNYVSATLMYFDVPPNLKKVSFKFRAGEMTKSVFACKPRDVLIYLKYGSLPVFNFDKSKFPPDYFLNGKADMHHINFTHEEKQYKYINLTKPMSGSYYGLAFHPYVPPDKEQITQEGLTAYCKIYIDANVYVDFENVMVPIVPDTQIKIVIKPNRTILYEMYVPESIASIQINLKEIIFCDKCKKLLTKFYKRNSRNKVDASFTTETEKNLTKQFNVLEDNYYYLVFNIDPSIEMSDILAKFYLEVKYNFYDFSNTSIIENNVTYFNAIQKNCDTTGLQIENCKQYNLHKNVGSETLLFSYEMQPISNGSIPTFINLASEEISVVKFNIKDVLDVGGSIQPILAFKPRVKRENGRIMINKEPENHKIVACIYNSEIAIPNSKEECKIGNDYIKSPIVLDDSHSNKSAIIPYPEPGDWYFSFKLFCGNEKTCKTSVIFDVSSYPCVSNGCGKNGRCVIVISDAVIFSTCRCTNNYRGWDCSDGSLATSIAMLKLEVCLLTLSNLVFILTAYFAFNRKYYVEMAVYSFTCFCSTFYHSCDAGEHVVSFCLVDISVLQFCDFYCALLSVWVTLIAMAYLPEKYPPILHICSAILLGAGITYNKTSLWVFMIPVLIGIGIFIGSWIYKYYKTKIIFPNKRYLKINLPLGILIVLIGFILFSFLQTKSNYKYLHSLWHIFMAIAVIILLPDPKTFLPPPNNL